MVFTKAPFSAPAILKSVVEKNNFSAKTLDFNLQFNTVDNDAKLQNFWQFGTADKSTQDLADQYINQWCDKILAETPIWVGISVFTYTCKIATEMLCRKLKSIDSKIKIVLGGNGMGSGGINGDYAWPKSLKTDKKLIDAYIRSEAEESIVQLLKGNKDFPGINDNEKKLQIENLDIYPIPSYQDYNLIKYESSRLPITGSRGCVRNCTFCDIHSHWKKFVFRSGESICNEMKELSHVHKIYDFSFTDSLVNGSMKAYRSMIENLSIHNESTTKPITWRGQFIARPSSQMTENDWKMTKTSGAKYLSIGVETGSDKVRHDIKKKFTNQDLDFCIEMAHKYQIKVALLMLIGYPTETQEDFDQTMDMFTRYQKYNNILTPVLGTTVAILPQTPLYNFALENNFTLGQTENEWWWSGNPNLTLKERFKRRILLGQHCEKLGYVLENNMNELKTMAYIWNNFKSNQKIHSSYTIKKNDELNQQYYS